MTEPRRSAFVRWAARRFWPHDVDVVATTIEQLALASRGRHFESDPDVTRWLDDLAAQVRARQIRRFQ